jgi:hypothetical protein
VKFISGETYTRWEPHREPAVVGAAASPPDVRRG